MNGQFLMNKAITVQYAFKKDGKGERHGTSAERLLAAQARKNNALPVAARPPPAPITFGAAPGVVRPPMPGVPYPGPYQGQFAGALAQPPPPVGFTPQQTMMQPPGPPPMGMAPPGMVPPMGLPMPPPPPPGALPMYGGFPPPPPPPGFGGPFPPQQPVPPQF
jgi:splicing factor 3B subunit 4